MTTAQVDEFDDTGPIRLQSAHEPTQATCAGNLVFVTSADGAFNALDLVTGVLRWRFITGGRLFSPPTIAANRCYIGSGNGSCCLVWRRLPAKELSRYGVFPSTRLMMVYGDLVSTWPVTGGVLVHNGVAYAIAGNLDVDGTYVVALDSRTGAVQNGETTPADTSTPNAAPGSPDADCPTVPGAGSGSAGRAMTWRPANAVLLPRPNPWLQRGRMPIWLGIRSRVIRASSPTGSWCMAEGVSSAISPWEW